MTGRYLPRDFVYGSAYAAQPTPIQELEPTEPIGPTGKELIMCMGLSCFLFQELYPKLALALFCFFAKTS